MLVAALAAAAVAAPTAQAGPTGPSGPCADPGLRCPNLVMRTPSELHLLPGGRLASTNKIVNIGVGPAEVKARRSGRRTMRGRQVIRARGGRAPVVLPFTGLEAEFYDTGTRGTYWKLEGLARFSLHALRADGTLAPARRFGPKLEYCLRDLYRVPQLSTGRFFADAPRVRQFPACSQDAGERTRTFGTSRGWTDAYPWNYPENWVSVRGLSGCFAYVQRVDPFGHFAELREDDNASAVVVRLPWRGLGRRGCPAIAQPLG